MGKDILALIEVLANEKQVDQQIVLESLEFALAAATRKKLKTNCNIRVAIDAQTGEQSTFKFWNVIADDEYEDELAKEMESFKITTDSSSRVEKQNLPLSKAREKKPNIEVGETIEDPIENVALDRIGAQVTKQVINQKINEAEKTKIKELFENKIGKIFTGTVKRANNGDYRIDLGDNAEGFLGKRDALFMDNFRVGDRVKALICDVSTSGRFVQISLSRTSPLFVKELFKIEIPEIADDLILINGVAREPGNRSKVAIAPYDPRVDAKGSCIGVGGRRIQAIVDQLSGERVDIIVWDSNDAQFIINAMAPAVIVKMNIDEDKKIADLAVEEENLSQAIGKNGVNIRLASELTGWTINVMNLDQLEEKNKLGISKQIRLFTTHLNIDEELATLLAKEGFSTLEEITNVTIDELIAIDGISEEQAIKLQNTANEALINIAFSDSAEQETDLNELDDMNQDLLKQLLENNVLCQEDLAEYSIDELQDIITIDTDLASKLIKQARLPWFADEKQEE